MEKVLDAIAVVRRGCGYAALLFLSLALLACSKDREFIIGGASDLAGDASPEEASLQVLSYPLSQYEIDYLASAIDPLREAAANRPELWASLQGFGNPVEAAAPNAIWKETQLNGEDVVAITMKLTFLREFGELQNPLEDMRANLEWLEKRAVEAENKAELEAAAEQLRGLIRLIETLESSGSFALYRENKLQYDAVLDRFLAIGEQ